MDCATTSGNGYKDLLPGQIGHVGATAQDNRQFVEAVLYRYRAGIPWRDLPERLGNWKNDPSPLQSVGHKRGLASYL